MRFFGFVLLALIGLAGCRCGEEPQEVIVMEPFVITAEDIAMAENGTSDEIATAPAAAAACVEEQGEQCL